MNDVLVHLLPCGAAAALINRAQERKKLLAYITERKPTVRTNPGWNWNLIGDSLYANALTYIRGSSLRLISRPYLKRSNGRNPTVCCSTCVRWFRGENPWKKKFSSSFRRHLFFVVFFRRENGKANWKTKRWWWKPTERFSWYFSFLFFFFFSVAAASLMRVRSPSRTRTGHWSTWLLSRANYYHWMQSDGPPQHRSVSSVPFLSSLSLRGELFLLFRVVSFSRRGQRLRFFPIFTKLRWRSSRVVSCGTQLDTAGYCFYRQSSRLVAMLTAEVARASVFCGDPWNEIEKLFAVELPADVLVYFFPPRALALDDGHKRWAISGRLWWRRRVWLCLQCKGMKETEVGLSLSVAARWLVER